MATAPGVIPSILTSRDRVALPGIKRLAMAPPTSTPVPEDLVFKLSGTLDRVKERSIPRVAEGHRLRSILEEVWFDKVHVFPRRRDLGNILSVVTDTIVIFNAFLDQSVAWSALANNGGTGVSVTGATPPPDVTIDARDGVLLTLSVSPVGPPTIAGSLDFTFTGLYTVPVQLTGSRLVVFAFIPEAPLRERLRWLTEIMEGKSGAEQRIALRAFPRQEFVFDLFLEEGRELTKFDNTVYDWQHRVFGVPVWFEPTVSTAAISTSDTVVSVRSTAYADYRVGGLAIVFQDVDNFDVLEIASFDGTSITFASPLGSDYEVGTLVMPVRTCRMTSRVPGTRRRVNAATRRVIFRVTDNDVGDSFGDSSAYSTYDGLVLLDDPNAVDGDLREEMTRRFVEFDNQTGAFFDETPWAQPKRVSAKGFRPKSREALWNIRRLLHFLGGRKKSLYLPTFYRDLVPIETLQGGTSSLVIEEAGFAQFVSTTRPNRSIVRMEPVSGSNQIRIINGAGALTNNREALTFSAAWLAGDLEPSEISRIMFFERVRIASDDVEIVHRDFLGQADISLPVITVFDS